MAIDLYNLGSRVRYADFLSALKDTVSAIVTRQGYAAPSISVGFDPNRPGTAAISVHRGGSNMALDLIMPTMDPDMQITGSLARDLLGFVMHEIGHALWTDTRVQLANNSVASQIGRAAGAGTPAEAKQITHKLQGVFEDYFIERKASADPSPIAQGAGHLLGSLNAEVMQGAEDGAAHPNPIHAAIAYAMTQIDRHGRQGQQALLDLAKAGQDKVSPEVRAVVDDLLDKLDARADEDVSHTTNVSRTAGRAELVRAAAARLVQLPEQQQQQPQQDEGEGEGEGDDQGEPTGAPNQGTGKPGSKSKAPKTPEGRDQQLAERIAQKTPRPETPADGYDASTALMAEMDGAGAGRHPDEIARDPGNRATARVAAHAANARRFADASRRALYSPDTVTVSRRLQMGRMDRRAITRAATGALDVFTRKRLDVGQRTAVVVMIDCSGSMDNAVNVAGEVMTRLEAVNGTAAAIIPAIERAGGEVAVGIFGGTSAYELKPWNKRIVSPEIWLDEQGDLDTFGGTPMLHGMLWAERQLKTRTRATRKVCIWLCDGAPDNARNLLARKIREQAHGIEHVGIGIQIDLDRAAYGNNPLFPSNRTITVQDLSRLAPAFETVLFEMGQDTERRLARR